jgi:DNA-binding GntR family transcriptional regulator
MAASRKETEGAKIVRQLRLEILFGRIQPEQILSQEDVCARFETSRMPARDALLQLAHEGFLERLSGNRLRVVKLDRVDFLDMIWIEAMVHALAVKRATERHNNDVSAYGELMVIQKQMQMLLIEGDVNRASELKGLFHRKINQMAESPKLVSTLRSVTLRIQYDFMYIVPGWLDRSAQDQENILEAMMNGDAENASKLMYEHLQYSASMIANVLIGSQSTQGEMPSAGFAAALSTFDSSTIKLA